MSPGYAGRISTRMQRFSKPLIGMSSVRLSQPTIFPKSASTSAILNAGNEISASRKGYGGLDRPIAEASCVSESPCSAHAPASESAVSLTRGPPDVFAVPEINALNIWRVMP